MFVDIESHGIISNGNTQALIAPDTSINWLPIPYTHMTPLFARILDSSGGVMKFMGVNPLEFKSAKNSLMLISRVEYMGTILEIKDFMPWKKDALVREISTSHQIPGFTLSMEIFPGCDMHAMKNGVEIKPHPWKEWGYPRPTVRVIIDDAPVEEVRYGSNGVEIELGKFSHAEVLLLWGERRNSGTPLSLVKNEYPDAVKRSILTLHALRSGPGILAAATTSIPVSGGNVWDYRYIWIRDGTYAMEAMLEIGDYNVVREYLEWLFNIMQTNGKPWSPMYTAEGNPAPYEKEIESMDGYKGAGLVRIGNRATIQFQLDSEGQVLSLLWRYVRETGDLEFIKKRWHLIKRVADFVCKNWTKKDSGPWETPMRMQYVYSKIECWTALDRTIKIARTLDMHIPEEWYREAQKIREWIIRNGVSKRGNYMKLAIEFPVPDVLGLAAGFRGMFPPDTSFLVKTFEIIRDMGKNGLYPRGPLDRLPFLFATGWIARYAVLLRKYDVAKETYLAMIKEYTPLFLLPENGSIRLFNIPKLIKFLITNPPSFRTLISSMMTTFRTKIPNKVECRGNLPQAYSHLELVRVWVALKKAGVTISEIEMHEKETS